jgi:hypothetical protein
MLSRASGLTFRPASLACGGLFYRVAGRLREKAAPRNQALSISLTLPGILKTRAACAYFARTVERSKLFKSAARGGLCENFGHRLSARTAFHHWFAAAPEGALHQLGESRYST